MNWNLLTSEEQLQDIIARSSEVPQVIFKHSTRCSISSTAKSRLERSAQPEGLNFHLLDLISYRGLSNKIAEVFHVHHESPQVIVIKNGECVYDESHMSISMDDITTEAGI